VPPCDHRDPKGSQQVILALASAGDDNYIYTLRNFTLSPCSWRVPCSTNITSWSALVGGTG